MRAWLRRALAAAAVLLALALAGLIALKVLYPPERIKSLALAKLQASLGREVRIASASIGLRAVELGGVEVSEVPDFKAGTLCAVKKVRLSYHLKPLLLHRRVEVGQLSAADWSVQLRLSAAEQKPKSPASKRPASVPHKGDPSPAVAQSSSPAVVAQSSFSVSHSSFSLDVSALSLTDGRIDLREASGRPLVRLDRLALKASDIRLDRPFPFSLDLAFEAGEGPSRVAGTLSGRGRLDWAGGDRARASAELKPLEARVGDAEASVEGRLRGLDSPEADLELSLSPLSRKSLRGAPGLASMLPADLRVPALKGGLRARRSGEVLDVQELFFSGGDLSAALSAENRGDTWRLRASHLGWKGAKAVLSGEVALASDKRKEPRLDLRLVTEKIPLAVVGSLVPAVEEYKARGVVRADLSAKGPASAPALSGDVSLDGVGLTAMGQAFTGLSGKVSFTDKTVRGALKGKLNQGDLDLELDARDYRGPVPDYRLKGTLSTLDLAALPDAKKPSGGPAEPEKSPAPKEPAPKEPGGKKEAPKPIDTSGSFTVGSIRHPKFEAAGAQLRWDLRGLSNDLSKLNGSASFRVGKGRLQELKSLGEGKPMLKMAFMPLMLLQRVAGLVKVPLFPAFDKATFESVTGDYSFTDGVMRIRESHLDSSVGYVAMEGSVDLGKETLDVHVLTRMVLKDIGGPLGFKVTGTFKEPKVRLDAAAILKQPVVEKAVDKAVEQGKELLKGLFKK